MFLEVSTRVLALIIVGGAPAPSPQGCSCREELGRAGGDSPPTAVNPECCSLGLAGWGGVPGAGTGVGSPILYCVHFLGLGMGGVWWGMGPGGGVEQGVGAGHGPWGRG